jgi:hypothetical protein
MATRTMRKQRRGMRRNLKSWLLATALLIALMTATAVAVAGIPLSQDGTRGEVFAAGNPTPGSGSDF